MTPQAKALPTLSVIIPAYNENDNVLPLFYELVGVLRPLAIQGRISSFEILFVDDGSTDGTSNALRSMHRQQNQPGSMKRKKSWKKKVLHLIKFKRNFGQTAALDAGIKAARGNILVTMDADLQNDPRDIPILLNKLEEGYDVVNGWRHKRQDPFTKRVASKLANALRNSLTGERIHDSGCSLKAMRKECFDGIDLYGEMHRYLPAILRWKGFRVGEVKVNHRQRKFGTTKYGPGRIMRGFLDLLIVVFWQRYSKSPIQLFGGVGLASFTAGFITGLWLTVSKFLYGTPLSNRPALLLAALLIMLGVQMMMFGVLADIMMKVYTANNKKQYTIEYELR